MTVEFKGLGKHGSIRFAILDVGNGEARWNADNIRRRIENLRLWQPDADTSVEEAALAELERAE